MFDTECGMHVHTCELDEPAPGPLHSYLCPQHPDGIENDDGWFCSALCREIFRHEKTKELLRNAIKARDQALKTRDKK
jgi:hypothetical protein